MKLYILEVLWKQEYNLKYIFPSKFITIIEEGAYNKSNTKLRKHLYSSLHFLYGIYEGFEKSVLFLPQVILAMLIYFNLKYFVILF